MAGTSEGAAKRKANEAVAKAASRKTASDAVLGKGPKPGFGTGAWARERGLWKDGDTEGPAPQGGKTAKP